MTVAWSLDGSRLATSSFDHTLRLWDAATGRQLHLLTGHSNLVMTVAWSPDGSRLASGSDDKTVRLWDAATGRELHMMTGHSDRVMSVAWSPDGSRLASGSYDRTVRLWAAASGRQLHSLTGNSSRVRCLAWSPDGNRLARGSDDDNIVRLRDAATGRQLHSLTGHFASVVSVGWSPDGKGLASGSFDNIVRIWDAESGRQLHSLSGHSGSVRSLVWSPDGSRLASGSYDNTVRLWDAATGRQLHSISGHTGSVRSLVWSPDGSRLASGSDDETVRLWDAATGRQLHSISGHTGSVRSLVWSPDGSRLASGSDDMTVRLWDAASGREVLVLEAHQAAVIDLTWNEKARLLAALSEDGVSILWDVNTGGLSGYLLLGATWRHVPLGLEFSEAMGWHNGDLLITAVRPMAAQTITKKQVLQTSAKVVLAGDSKAGKTCLARRLAEDTYIEGQDTTHGMQIWTLAAEKLHSDGAPPPDQLREIFLWDLGGQDEYQLVNQMFLHDTTVALVLFDGTRGHVGMETAEAWNERLEVRGHATMRKLLVRSKADEAGVVQEADIEALRLKMKFQCALAVSAANETGIPELKEKLHHAIDWQSLSKVSRPPAFQHIRDHLAEARQRGECIVYHGDLAHQLEVAGQVVEPGELRTTLEHLAREGQIVDVSLASGDRVLVLRIDVISRYAGSLVQAARTHAWGVPVLEQDRILAIGMAFPGMKNEDRLPRAQERIVLECVVRLMIERGLCFDQQGLLVFPTLFSDLAEVQGELPPSAPIYYDFNGAIDNIYASLVARLRTSGRFGAVRLWARYAEFGAEARTFGIRRADKSKGRGHLDLMFGAGASQDDRSLFRDFVDDHLKSEGVNVLSGLAFACQKCSFEFSEPLLRRRMADGKSEVNCPECDERYSLMAEAESRSDLTALKTEIEARIKVTERAVAAQMEKGKDTAGPLRILHLSDLHFTGETKVDTMLQPLEADLRDRLNVKALDYLVVSGDFADAMNWVGFRHGHSWLN